MLFAKHNFTQGELKLFDASRGLLAILVVIAHINQTIWSAVYGIGMASTIFGLIANISVVIFFFLSGVLITYSGFNMMSEDGFNYKKFFINRVTRIYPTLIASLFIVFVLMKLFPFLNDHTYIIKKLPTDLYTVRDVYFVSPSQIFKTITLLVTNIIQLNGPMWSLFIEWWLYMSAMFIFISIKKKNKFLRYVFLIISIVPLVYIFKHFSYSSIFYIAIWFLGFLYTAVIANYERIKQYLLIVAGIIVSILLFMKGIVVFNAAVANPFYYGFIQLFFAILYLNYFLKLNFLKFFTFFSPFSYTLYLIHFPIMLFIHSILRVYTGNNLLYLSIETIVDFTVVILISYFLAKITEDKKLFRRFFANRLNIEAVNVK